PPVSSTTTTLKPSLATFSSPNTPPESWTRPAMTKQVASTAPAYLLKVRSLIFRESALFATRRTSRRKRGNPAPCCVRLSYTLPALAQPPKQGCEHPREPHRPDPRAHGRDSPAREAAGG